MPNTLFHAYSCAAEMPFSLAKVAQEPFDFDSAYLVHWSVTPEGVGEGMSLSAGLTAGDPLAVSVESIDCLFTVPMEVAFGLLWTPLSSA